MIRPVEALSAPPAEATVRELDLASRRGALRAVDAEDAEQEARARLIVRLAADRLRELRDDGVTFGYIARMYDAPADAMKHLYDDLVQPRGAK
jgi:hypothetical protein